MSTDDIRLNMKTKKDVKNEFTSSSCISTRPSVPKCYTNCTKNVKTSIELAEVKSNLTSSCISSSISSVDLLKILVPSSSPAKDAIHVNYNHQLQVFMMQNSNDNAQPQNNND